MASQASGDQATRQKTGARSETAFGVSVGDRAILSSCSEISQRFAGSSRCRILPIWHDLPPRQDRYEDHDDPDRSEISWQGNGRVRRFHYSAAFGVFGVWDSYHRWT